MTEITATENAAYWEGAAETWTRLVREGHDIYRDHHNTPAFLDMLPSVTGLPTTAVGEANRVLNSRGFIESSILHPCFALGRPSNDLQGALTKEHLVTLSGQPL